MNHQIHLFQGNDLKSFLSFVLIFPFLGFIEKVVIEDLMEVVVVDGGTISGSLSPMEVTLGFSFLASPLMNHIIIDDFKQMCNAHTFVKAHHCAFGCDSTNNEVRW